LKINLKLFYLLLALFLIFPGKEKIFAQDFLNSDSSITIDPEQGFKNPPLYAKPRVFWWWLNSMVTKESITRDLEELKAKGFGGALIFDAGSSNYQVAKKTKRGPDFGSPAWIELFIHALKEADRLGLEMSFNIVSGWNPGGPTVKPADALKKITWSEKIVEGPSEQTIQLPVPEGKLYKDICIQAFPADEHKDKKYLSDWELKSLNDRFKGFDDYPLNKLREEADTTNSDFDLKTSAVIDITANLDKDGKLKWKVPVGKWKILRMGSCITGVEVSTASDGYSGLSFDHLSSDAFKKFFREAVAPILDKADSAGVKSLKYLMTDSWEMDIPNWTDNFIQEFTERRGYNPLPYLSAVTGEIVENREISNRFLYDFRKTIGDCIADRMYAEFAKAAHERGLFVHPESGGPHAAPIDGLKCLGRNDYPMGEFWAKSNTHRYTEDHRFFVKQSASAAHIYGKRFVAGEGPTSIGPQWERPPKDLKSDFDRNLCEGINRFFWHCFTSSPKEFGLPGNEYFAGTHMNPNVTWWNMSGGFIKYLSRASFLLSQGLFQADVCFYYGDDVPNFGKRKKINPELGYGYDYDDCNAEVILNRMSVKDGKIILPDGMSYQVLRLPDRDAITPEVLEKIEQLVKDGATIAGQKPVKATGLKNYPASDTKVKEIADRLWGNTDGKNITCNNYGKGRVYWGKDLKDILAEKRIYPDFNYTSSQDSTLLDYIHRRADGADIYFVVNRLARYGIYDTKYRYFTDLPDRFEQVDCKFRVTGKEPEIWDAKTGTIEKASVYREENGYTIIPLLLKPEDSKFVIFRDASKGKHIVSIEHNGKSLFPVSPVKPGLFPPVVIKNDNNKFIIEAFKTGNYSFTFADGKTKTFKIKAGATENVISGGWDVNFTPGWGAPEKIKFDSLYSWTESADPGIKYYSGTAEYNNEFILSQEQIKKGKIYLDAGNIQEIGEVYINDKMAGSCWTPPYITDITSFVKAGKNKIVIKVANMWPNRLIGDQHLPPEKRYTRTNVEKFKADDPLRASGLIGQVKVIIPEAAEIGNK
jgi:hypothetical protein